MYILYVHLERLLFLFYLSRWAYLAQIAWYRRENDTIAAPRRYVQYFICIRTEEMARTLMFLADASRKAFLYLPSFSFGDWSECVQRICQPPLSPPFLQNTRRQPQSPLDTRFLSLSRIKSRGVRLRINSANPRQYLL